MKVVILAGGFGTRLSEETSVIPKPMIEIGGRPLLWHLMSYFSHHNINDFIVALGYKSEVIKRYFLQYPQLQSNLRIDLAKGVVEAQDNNAENWRIELVDTGIQTMTGGRLLRLKDRMESTFVFTYGDGLSNVQLDKLLAFHKSHGKLATVTAVKPVSRFGLMKLDDRGEVTSFAEKPSYENTLVNGGFFILEPEIFNFIEGDDTSWEQQPCERLVSEGQMMAYQHQGFWQCVDTLHELRILRQLWESGNAQWKVW